MKYAKELATSLSQLPTYLQRESLDYKAWKKRCKTCTLEEAIVTLKRECEQVDRVFQKCYGSWKSKPWMCWKQSQLSPTALLQFAKINATTTYKICKRLQKSLDTPTTMTWLTSVRSLHVFAFLGGHHTTHLEFSCTDCSLVECPLCINEVTKNNMLIYTCGHHACVDCALQYAQITVNNGLWYNVILYARRKSCPYCRFDKALNGITTI
jgi:hypothetical protein